VDGKVNMYEDRARILIVKHGALGDVLRISYLLPGLLQVYGCHSEIYWYTHPGSLDLLRFNPYIYRIVTNSDEITGVRFDLVLSFDDELEQAMVAGSMYCRKLVGAYVEEGRVVYTEDSSEWFDMGIISRFGEDHADRLKKLNKRSHAHIFSKMLGVTVKDPYFKNSPIIESYWERILSGPFFKLGINPAAGARWPSKSLRECEILPLIESAVLLKVGERPVKVFLLGEGEVRLTFMEVERVLGRCVTTLNTSSSVLDLAAAVKALDYLISSDSLALHLGIAQGIRNLSFYAPTSAVEIETFGLGVKVISTSEDYCSYERDADNTSITAERIMSAFCDHLHSDGEKVVSCVKKRPA